MDNNNYTKLRTRQLKLNIFGKSKTYSEKSTGSITIVINITRIQNNDSPLVFHALIPS